MNTDLANIPNLGDKLWASLKNKNIFLTGGTGFFGRSLLEIINFLNSQLNLNIHIFLLTRSGAAFQLKYPQLCSENLHLISGDIVNFTFPENKIDYILHFASPADARLNSENPLLVFDTIINGMRRILDFAVKSNCEKFLFASSGAVYGKQPHDLPFIPESYLGAPLTTSSPSAYGEAKRAAELMGNIYADKFKFEYKIARCFAFIGPDLDPHGSYAIGNFIWDALKQKKILIKGDGTPYRSYLDSRDLVLWLLTILLQGVNRQPYNVGSDQEINISGLARKVKQLVAPEIQINLAKRNEKALPADRYVPDISLAKTLGLSVWTSLDEAILRTARSYKQYGNLKD